jgi:hypothetical protein
MLRRIIEYLVYPDNLVDIIVHMINPNRLANNRDTPLELIDFESLSRNTRHTFCIMNKNINPQFITDNLHLIDEIKTLPHLLMRFGVTLRQIIDEFVDCDDLTIAVYIMVNQNILAHNPNTPLEFMNFKLSSASIRHAICIKNRNINRRFVLAHIKDIPYFTSWRYIRSKVTIDTTIFNLLSRHVREYLAGRGYSSRIKVPKTTLMYYLTVDGLKHLAKHPMTSDEIIYMLSRPYDEDELYELYSVLMEYQYLTPHHLDIMRSHHPEAAVAVINESY